MTFRTVPDLLRLAADLFGGSAAIVTGDHVESFTELLDAVRGAAEALKDRGLHPGDRVLLASPNSPALIHAWLGAIWAGGIPAAVNPDSAPAEFEYFSDDLRPKVTLLHHDVEAVGTTTSTVGDAVTADPLDVAAIVYTSGTTSRPKGVMVRQAAYTETGQSFPRWIGLTGEQRLWACLPFFHINAQAYSLMSALAHGFSLALSPRFRASTFWREAGNLQVTSVNLVGAMLEFLATQPRDAWVESPLRTMYCAPGPTPRLRAKLESRFRVRIVTGYGLSENPFGCIETTTSRVKASSIGRPRQPASGAFENELRILRPDGSEAPVEEIGELCFRNPVMTPGYWNASDVTAAALHDGWLHTGDAGYRDRDGDVFLTGRYKEMIRRRGENIAPAEVEDVLRGHPAVEAVAVFGIAAGLQEEDVVAAIVLKDGAKIGEADLKAYAAARLTAFKVPGRIIFRESLPLTPTHRVAKDVLRREFQARELPSTEDTGRTF
jgi:carnitine-CoA ligase